MTEYDWRRGKALQKSRTLRRKVREKSSGILKILKNQKIPKNSWKSMEILWKSIKSDSIDQNPPENPKKFGFFYVIFFFLFVFSYLTVFMNIFPYYILPFGSYAFIISHFHLKLGQNMKNKEKKSLISFTKSPQKIHKSPKVRWESPMRKSDEKIQGLLEVGKSRTLFLECFAPRDWHTSIYKFIQLLEVPHEIIPSWNRKLIVFF